MEPRPARRFTLADGMALTAASGIGFALARSLDDFAPVSIDWRWGSAVRVWALALPSTVALTLLRLFDRRAPRHRFRSPGASACLAASIAPLLTLAFEADRLVSTFRFAPYDRDSWLIHAWGLLMPHPMAVAVAGSWAALALGRRWRPEPGWLDRAGIGLGALWIASMLAVPALNLWPR